MQEGHIPNLNKIPHAILKISVRIFCFSLSFCTLCKICYNSHICAPIWLKFGPHIGGLKANTRINSGVTLVKIQGVVSDFTYKSKSTFCLAYMVNCFKEQAENQYVARLKIRGVPFGG